MAKATRSTLAVTVMLALSACSDDDDKARKQETSCSPDDVASCDDGLVCEQLGNDGERFACLPPVLVTGRVINALDGRGIEGATLVGLDANAAARTRVARSGADGSYELPVSMRRNEDGSPTDESITLRVAAADHQAFPSAPRTALPIELASAVGHGDAGAEAATFRVQNAATEVALIPLPASEQGGATVTGRVAAADPGGVLVLAVAGEKAASSTVSDRDGEFMLFNVPEGAVTVEGYRAGLSITPESVSVKGDLGEVVLEASSEKLATVSGMLSIVNADGGLKTSVILVVASTFDPAIVRGEAPSGLRAADVSGAFRIENVPPGRYAVLAAFENDQLVRDPDQGIGGTEVVFVDVGNTGGDIPLPQSFKVTEALRVKSPGANGVEPVQAGMLTLSWTDDSSEEGYELRVYDALGELVHEDKQVPQVTGSTSVTYALDASAYKPGMLYQFRVWSFRAGKGKLDGERSFISASEDLKGVFEIAR